MQRVRKNKLSQKAAILILVAALVLIGLVSWLLIALFSEKPTTTVTAVKMPCVYSDTIKPFGENLLLYDGKSIHCIASTGATRWSFQVGPNAGYDCNEDTVAAWTGSTIYILDENGNSSYNDSLGDEIQFARVGKQYVGAVIGDTENPRLVVKDLEGGHMDEETDAYSKLILLDLGFYGPNGQYMWTLALDVFGTAANTIMNTFEVGKMNTGEVSLGEPITYSVLYENNKLRVINTRKMLTFDYRGNEDLTGSVLVYGWRLLDTEVPERGDALLLFAPTSQTDHLFDITSLRLLSGSKDKRFTMSANCVGAALWNKTIYAISGDQMFRAGMNDTRFAAFSLPLERPVTDLIGTLSNGKIVVACSEEVYVLTLPQGFTISDRR
ncbi:MAG: hypothetical protein IJ041_05395 [Clostridia bacterium]|nr:hypothetical protein [Clostridia bacterium]